eukprot:g2910.t1
MVQEQEPRDGGDSAMEAGDAEHAPQCRICFDDAETAETGRLFRPCSCRGSMAWVHVECLDKWRKSSANPRAFFRCEQCLYEYRFGRAFSAYGPDRLSLARFLSGRFAVHILSVAVLLALVFVGGFVAKAFDPKLTWLDVFACFNLGHILAGSVLVGGFSLLGWL